MDKTNRLTRITAILIQLQSRKVVRAREIAERFDVSLRTVYRDIATLQEAGVPIGSENGLGYFIIDGYHLPPVSITEEEANALIVSEKLIQNQGDKSLSRDFTSFVIKIRAVLKSVQKDQADFLENRIEPSIKKDQAESNHLSEIQKAITRLHVLDITYLSIYKEEKTKRQIEPLAIYFTDKAWVVIAWCRLRKTIREFRLDRIVSLQTLPEKFQTREFNLSNYFENFSDPS